MSAEKCHFCGSNSITEIHEFATLRRVTSDCKPWQEPGRLAWCSECDGAQAILDAHWYSQAAEIYRSYDLNQIGGGLEQNVFDAVTGQATARSSRLLQQLAEEVQLPQRGKLLDIGCGTGSLLAAFARAHPDWQLYGSDINERSKSVVEAIPGVQKLFVGPFEAVTGSYQFISLIHSLEHIPNPAKALRHAWDLLADGGLLLVQVPNCEINPFVYLVADHSAHFFPSSLLELAESEGYQSVVPAQDWIAKEITYVGRKSIHAASSRAMRSTRSSLATIRRQVMWLKGEASRIEQVQNRPSVGILGTTFAGTWAYAQMDKKPAFFIDEDPHKVGRSLFGLPVIRPEQVPPGSDVIMPYPRQFAESIVARLAGYDIRWHLPADITDIALHEQ